MKKPGDVLLTEVLNPGGRGGHVSSLKGDWTLDRPFMCVKGTLNSGEVKLTVHVMPTESPYVHDLFNGGREHQSVCRRAAAWIDKEWNVGPSKFEEWAIEYTGMSDDEKHSRSWVSDAEAQGFCTYMRYGGRADIVTVDEKLYVECGFITTPEKIIDAGAAREIRVRAEAANGLANGSTQPRVLEALKKIQGQQDIARRAVNQLT